MFRVTVWLQLLLVVLILRQSAAASDGRSELHSELDRLEEALKATTSQKQNCETMCQERLTNQIRISQNTSRELQKSEAVIRDLKKKLEAKEEPPKSKNQKQEQLQTAIDGLTKIVESLNQKAQVLYEKQEKLQTTIDGLKKTVEPLNQRSQLLCDIQTDVCQSLLKAAESGDVDSAKALLTCDSSDTCTDDGLGRDTPLTYAAKGGHVEVVRVLLESGANVERATVHGHTALHVAAWNGHLDVCRLLLDWGANVNSLDEDNRTPLHDAAERGYLSIVKLLVERGANVSLHHRYGKTPSGEARSQSKKDVADWLDSVSRGKER